MDSKHRAGFRIEIFPRFSLVAFGLAIAGAKDMLAGLAKSASPGKPALVLAALFGSTLAPIARRFGWGWGS